MKYNRLTERRERRKSITRWWTNDGESLKVYKHLAKLEDKIEADTLVEVSKGAVVLTPEKRAEEMRLCNEERKQAVGEFVERLKKELFAKCTYILTVDNPNDYDMKSDEVNALIDELAKEVCGE